MAFKTSAELFGNNIPYAPPVGWGDQVPISFTAPTGTYAATNRGIGFGEQLTSAIANRSHYALGLNDDDLNTRLALFEASGLDAAYRGGVTAVPGVGAVITLDGRAVETVSTLASAYANDVANAHFRANAMGDSTPGGGFDFRGRDTAAYGYLSRVRVSPTGTYTLVGATSAVTLNPGGVGGDIVRFAANVKDGSGNTDVAYAATDFLEISGAGGLNGLYLIFSAGPTNLDWVVRKMDGTAPAFGANTVATADFFTTDLMTSTRAGWLGVGVPLLVGGTNADESSIIIATRDLEGMQGVGPQYGIEFLGRLRDGTTVLPTRITGLGRIKSSVTSDTFFGTAFARDVDWAEGGIPFLTVDKGAASAGYHEIGALVQELSGTSSSWAGLETRGRILETTVLGVNASIPGTFAAPMGRILLPDSDGAPAPPAGQFKTLWALFVQAGVTLVRILTGTGAGRYYLLSAVNLTAAGPNADEIVVTHIDGSALDVGELPTVGALTFQFVQRQVVSGKLPPIPIESAPSGFSAPTDFAPSTVLAPPTEVAGDPSGLVPLAVRGSIFGVRSFDQATVALPATVHADLPWVLDVNGNFYTKGEIISDDHVQGETVRVNNDYQVGCEQTDRTYNVDLRTGQPEEDGTGAPLWRFNRTNGDWELITLGGGGDSAIWFPVTFTGRLMQTYVQAFASAGAFHSVYAALAVTTPDWGTPANAPSVTNANETTIVFANGAWDESWIDHSLGLGTLIALGANNYAIRVRGERVGDRIRAIKFVIRFTTIGPGGVGG